MTPRQPRASLFVATVGPRIVAKHWMNMNKDHVFMVGIQLKAILGGD
jgi:hypothetical protein